MSKVNRDFTNKISYAFVEISLPIVNATASPFNLLINLVANFEELANAKKENEKLQQENEEMRQKLIEAIRVNNENQELKNILKFVVPKSTSYKAAKIRGRSRQLFTNNLILEGKEGVKMNNGSAVISSSAMIGRVVESAGNKARLLLLTDSNSKIPILISEARARGILTGTNSSLMEVNFLPKNHNIEVGDLVFTSGDGETVPPGLLVGVIKKVVAKKVYVEMAQEVVNADIVTIIDY